MISKSMLFPVDTSIRETKSLDGLWSFCYDPAHAGIKCRFFEKEPEGTRPVAVPASLNEQMTDAGEYNNTDWVWYFHRFIVPSGWKNKRVFLRFGSASFRAEVFLNGKKLGSHEGGYMPFEFEIGSAVLGGENFIAVRVDNLLDDTTIPQGNLDPAVGGVAQWRVGNYPNVHYDFFPFTGIHRPVVLYATGHTRLEWLRLATKSHGKTVEAVAEAGFSGGAATVEFSIPETGFSKKIAVSDGKATVSTLLRIPSVGLWSPENPRLYKVVVSLFDSSGAMLDEYILPFGFRTVGIKGGKFLLNGKPVFFRGFGRHEDINVIGRGMNFPFMVKDYGLMKWMGANSFRTSHYPYSEEMMAMADREGFLVIDEVAANTLSMKAVAGNPSKRALLASNHKAQIDELIERDYNHPCVVAWSLGNECESYFPEGKGYFSEMVAHAKTRDLTRPITFVVMKDAEQENDAESYDFICVNTYPSWYWDCGRIEKIPDSLRPLLEGYWKKYKKPVIVSEFGADTIPGLHSEYGLMWSEEFQVEMIKKIIGIAEEYPFVCGTHIWNFADFKVGQHTGRIILNWKGLFTRERHPKMAAHEIKKLWAGNTGK